MNRLTIATIVVATFSLMACSSSKEVKTDPTSAAWRVIQIGAKNLEGMDASMLPTMAFDPSKLTVSGSTGCNNYTGPYDNDLTALRFKNLAVTKKACSDMTVETAFLDALSKAAKMKVEDDVLTLFDAAGTELLKAKAQE